MCYRTKLVDILYDKIVYCLIKVYETYGQFLIGYGVHLWK